MVLLFSPTAFLEIAVFLLAVAAFGLALRFFMNSRKRLAALFPEIISQHKRLPFNIDRKGFVIPKTPAFAVEHNSRPGQKPAAAATEPTGNEINSLRTLLQQQQAELQKALQQIETFGQKSKGQEAKAATLLMEQKKLEHLHLQLKKKDAEIEHLRQQQLIAQKLQLRFEEVQTELEAMQKKMLQIEKQDWLVAEYSTQLRVAEQTHRQTEKTLLQKEDSLCALVVENQQLHKALDAIKEKLAQTNLQRLQLEKKVQVLEFNHAGKLPVTEASPRYSV